MTAPVHKLDPKVTKTRYVGHPLECPICQRPIENGDDVASIEWLPEEEDAFAVISTVHWGCRDGIRRG